MGTRRRALALFAVAALACAGARAGTSDLVELMDNLVRQGDETPQAAIASINALSSKDFTATPLLARTAIASIGIIEARDGQDAEALAQVRALLALDKPTDALAEADAHLVRAEIEVNAGHGEASYAQARAALAIYDDLCAPGPKQRADCDYRAWWHALDLAQRGASGQGNIVVASAYAQTMLDVARRAGDHAREALSLGITALQAEANGDSAAANRLIAQAQHIAHVDGAPWLLVRVAVLDGQLHYRRQRPGAAQRDYEAVQRAYEAGLAIANEAGLTRPAMLLRANLSDTYIHQGRPADALAAIELALPVARQHRDRRTERLLLHNATLAKLALGRVAEAKIEMAQVLALWQRDTGPGQRREALREFGDALAKAGDTAGAIDLFHKEEALSQEIRAANKAAAEAELRARYDLASQKRRIELLGRDNQLKSIELDKPGAHAPAVDVRRRRDRAAGRAGAADVPAHARAQRHARQARGAAARAQRARRAHRAGQPAPVPRGDARVRRRRARVPWRAADGWTSIISSASTTTTAMPRATACWWRWRAGSASAMRGDDLVARWGGEEFLVFAPNVDGPELDQLAERVRVAMSQAPVMLESGTAIETTVSIGYAAFPLPASHTCP